MLEKILAWKIVAWIIRVSKKIVLPGFDGKPLYDVTIFFFKGLVKGYITLRAAAISFSLFLAIFPFLIFLFTIIPFIPIENFQQSLMELIRELLPRSAYDTVKGTILDIVTRPRSSLMIFNLVLTLYFSTNGINSLIEAFNNSAHVFETRSMIKQYLISVLILIILSILLIISIGLMTFGSSLLQFILPDFIEKSIFFSLFVEFLRWLVIFALLLFAISFLYALAPAKAARFRILSAGSMLATILVILTTLGFNFYVDHFSSYNVLYGSLGTLMIVLMWIYINAISLLIGFELNVSIKKTRE